MRCFYDMNLRPRQWNVPRQRLCELGIRIEVERSRGADARRTGGNLSPAFSLESFCRVWASKYNIDAICVTLGDAGCCVYENQSAVMVPGFPVAVEDTVGAGDAFAAAFLHGYHREFLTLSLPVSRTRLDQSSPAELEQLPSGRSRSVSPSRPSLETEHPTGSTPPRDEKSVLQNRPGSFACSTSDVTEFLPQRFSCLPRYRTDKPLRTINHIGRRCTSRLAEIGRTTRMVWSTFAVNTFVLPIQPVW